MQVLSRKAIQSFKDLQHALAKLSEQAKTDQEPTLGNIWQSQPISQLSHKVAHWKLLLLYADVDLHHQHHLAAMYAAGLGNVLRSLAKYAAAESTRLGRHVHLHYFAPALVFSDGPASLAVLNVRHEPQQKPSLPAILSAE